MHDTANYVELVKQAQLGDQESMNCLARLAKGRLCAYIYRLTLSYDLTQDLLQETLLEMIESLKRLERADRFWSWLYRTATGKAQHHFRELRGRKKVLQMSAISKENLAKLTSSEASDGLSAMVRKELKEAVFGALARLKFRHRTILVLRCIEQKPYSEIASIMDCSEMAAQLLFFRAKRSLKRQLSKHGFGKGFLLMALGLFARVTAPGEASSAAVTVTSASAKVGLIATVIGAASTKFGIGVATIITAAVLTVGGITAVSDNGTGRGAGVEFEYPYQLLGAYDPDGNGWQGVKAGAIFPIPIIPERWLVGPPPEYRSALVLPMEHWVELKFRGRIVDGPGHDVLLVEWDANGEVARVFITDGAGNEYPLGMAMAGTSGQPSRTKIGFDISGISLPFVPCAVRIVGVKEGGRTAGFDLNSVRARPTNYPEDF
jgi:RNA polymerase sigma-70 factor (ECF subfamily)